MAITAANRNDPSPLSRPDRDAIARMHAVRPVWRGVALARDCVAFPQDRTILHAGPPATPEKLCRPLANSIVMAIVYEGWAPDSDRAEAMLREGAVRLASAQDHRVMLPLAAVLSPNMAVQIVVDQNDPDNVVHAPLNGGMVSAQRLGLAGPKILSHLRWINGNLAATLGIVADRDVPLIQIADAALAAGDDCHGRTASASGLVVQALASRLGVDTPERRFLNGAPGFFLNLWMAAVKCIAHAGEIPGSSLITALGGNGAEVGLQVGDSPGRWFVTPAEAPVGTLEPGFTEADRLGAIGDSALVDGLGFGAMVRRPGADAAGDGLLPLPHPDFARTGISVGLPVRRILETGTTPSIALGILDRAGRNGRIGAGVYRPPAALFAQACQALN